jgi:hypothetical protein
MKFAVQNEKANYLNIRKFEVIKIIVQKISDRILRDRNKGSSYTRCSVGSRS